MSASLPPGLVSTLLTNCKPSIFVNNPRRRIPSCPEHGLQSLETLSLRCIEDLHLADTPTSVVTDYVKYLFLAPRMRCTPWLHLVATLASSLPHCRNIEVFFFAPLTLHGLSLRSLSSVHALLPRALPSTYSNFRKLSLNNHHFRAFSELLSSRGASLPWRS